MKTQRNWLMAMLFLSAGALLAQTEPAPAPVAPAPAKAGENVVIHLEGKYAGVPVDAHCALDANATAKGGAATFVKLANADSGLPTYLTVDITTKATDSGYQTEFTVGAQVPQQAGATAPVSYHAQHIQASALLQPDKPMVIYQNEDTLTATLEKPPAGPAGAGSLPTLNDGKFDANLQAVFKTTAADGTSKTVTMALAGANASLSTIGGWVSLPGISDQQPIFETITLALTPEQDGLGAQFSLSKEMPLLAPVPPGRGAAAAAPMAGLTYRMVPVKFSAAVAKLDQPVTLYSSAGESITLMLSRTDK